MKTLSLGYSPCPNDTFIFYAMVHGRVDTKNLSFRELLLDVETLNERALRAGLDLSKISYHAFGHVRNNYCLLRAGGALGRGCGPLVIAKHPCSMEELKGKRVAIPGKLTTAYLLLQLFDPSFIPDRTEHGRHTPDVLELPFYEIIDAVSNENADAGLIIHESRFTYPSRGLQQIMDLGEWWEEETGLPVPLGGIIAKRSLGDGLNKIVNTILRSSVEYAFDNRQEPMNYIQEHSQELSMDVINRHIDLYVNDFSLDVGEAGEKAVSVLLSRAVEAGIIPKRKHSLFQ